MSVLTFDHPAEVLRRRAELEADQASAEELGVFLRMEAELGEPLGPFLEKVSGDSPSLILADYRAALTEWETLTARALRLKHRAEMLALVLTERAELAASSPAEMLTTGLEGTDTAPHRRERTRPPRPRGRYCIARHIASNAPPAVVCPVPTQAPHGSAPPG